MKSTTSPITGKPARDRLVAEIEEETALVIDGLHGIEQLAALVRAIDRQRLWHLLVFDETDVAAMRDVARVRRALEAAHERLKAQRQGQGQPE